MSRKLLYALLIPALLLVGGYLYIRFQLRGDASVPVKKVDSLGGQKTSALDLRPVFIERMQQLVKKSSDGLYDVSVGDMQVDVLASTVLLSDVKLQTDTARFNSLKKTNSLPADIYSIDFESLKIEGINLDDAVTSKTMDYEIIRLTKPLITIHRQKNKKEKKEGSSESFSQRFLKEMDKFSIKNLVVEDGEIAVYNETEKKPSVILKQVTVDLSDILVDSTTRDDKERFLFANKGKLSFKDFIKPTKDGLYELKIGETIVSSSQPEITLKNFSFASPLNKAAFVKKQTLSKELYNLSLPSISMSGVDWWTLLNEEEITANEIKTTGGKLSIYLDRSLPPKNKMGNFPSQLLMKMPLKLDIKKASVNKLNFSYEEYSPISQQSGTVFFDDVNIDIANISNIQMKPMTVKGTALFMHKVPLNADFVFDMQRYKTGAFTATIKAPAFDGEIVNSFVSPMGLMKVESGKVLGLEASITGNQTKANGNVKFLYKDLKLELLEKDKGEKALDKKGFTTFVANLLVLKKDNDGDSPRTAKPSFTRIPEGGYFMLIWKTVLVGILKTIGAPEKLAYKTVATKKK